MTVQRTDLGDALVSLIRQTGIKQVELAARTGFSEEHITQMMRQRAGSLTAWDHLLRTAGVTINPSDRIITVGGDPTR